MNLAKLNQCVSSAANWLQSPLLLVIRLYFGWQLFLTGKGKLAHLGGVGDYFASLRIPAPHVSAALAGVTECAGGVLLFFGLVSRLISIPLTVILVLAYLTADNAALRGFFSAPDKFAGAAEFPFLFAVLVILVFGPGRFSLDALLFKKSESGK